MTKAALAVAVVGAALLASGSAEAQATQKFLHIPGIPGDATEIRHKDWIELTSFGQTLTPSRSRRMSCQGEITKFLDRSSPALWAAVATGDSFPEMTVEFVKSSGGRGDGLFLQQKLIDVKVRRVALQETGAAPAEALTLFPESIILKYFPQLPDGTTGAPIERTISCARDHDDRFDANEANRPPREQP